jgi:hypothetical protein
LKLARRAGILIAKLFGSTVPAKSKKKEKTMHNVTFGSLFLAALTLIYTNYAAAGSITVTEPTGLLLSQTNGGYVSDPFSTNTWYRADSNGGSSGITTNFPNSGNGSAYLSTTNSNAFAQMNYYLSSTTTLGSLSELSYQWLRSGTSTAPAYVAPTLILYVDPDGTGIYSGGLIFSPDASGVPTDTFQTSNPLTGEWNWYQFGTGQYDSTSRTLADWLNGDHSAGFATLSANSILDGFDFQVGPGGAGLFVGAVDQFSYGFLNGASTTVNFEAAVPEPSSALFAAAGLLTLGASLRKRCARKFNSTRIEDTIRVHSTGEAETSEVRVSEDLRVNR